MKILINRTIKNPLILGSSILVIGSMLANILNYFFNLGAGRFLTPSDYGSFIALISIFNIFSVFSLTISAVFTKFTAMFVAQKRENAIGSLFVSGSLWIGAFSLLMCGLIILFSTQISNFLNISFRGLIVITSAVLFLSFLSYVGIGIIQGLLKFGFFVFLNIFSSFVKLTLGLGLILLGFRVFGAMIAIFVSVILTYIFIFLPISKFLKKRSIIKLSIPGLRNKLSMYALPVLLSNIGITALTTMDIILVKHFFDGTSAGHYAALSIMGRSIFYAISPIAFVLFPLIAQKKERKEKLMGTLLLAIIIALVPSICLSAIYFVFPQFVLSIFYPGKEYVVLTSYLGAFSIFILLYLFSYIFNMFYLSIGDTNIYIFTLVAATLEILFISFFHQSFSQIITGLIIISFLLTISLLLYYPRATRSFEPYT